MVKYDGTSVRNITVLKGVFFFQEHGKVDRNIQHEINPFVC